MSFTIFRADERAWSTSERRRSDARNPAALGRNDPDARERVALAAGLAGAAPCRTGSGRALRRARRNGDIGARGSRRTGRAPDRIRRVVEPGTALQVRNESDAEATILIVGAPPVTGRGRLPAGRLGPTHEPQRKRSRRRLRSRRSILGAPARLQAARYSRLEASRVLRSRLLSLGAPLLRIHLPSHRSSSSSLQAARSSLALMSITHSNDAIDAFRRSRCGGCSSVRRHIVAIGR